MLGMRPLLIEFTVRMSEESGRVARTVDARVYAVMLRHLTVQGVFYLIDTVRVNLYVKKKTIKVTLMVSNAKKCILSSTTPNVSSPSSLSSLLAAA